MELKEFVSQTLIQITEGVETARLAKGRQIAHPLDVNPKENDAVIPVRDCFEVAQMVTFDVAVTASEKSEAGAGAGIHVMSLIKVGGERSSATESSSVSRIRFEVPISYEGPE